jgi:hypothetical protein
LERFGNVIEELLIACDDVAPIAPDRELAVNEIGMSVG